MQNSNPSQRFVRRTAGNFIALKSYNGLNSSSLTISSVIATNLVQNESNLDHSKMKS